MQTFLNKKPTYLTVKTIVTVFPIETNQPRYILSLFCSLMSGTSRKCLPEKCTLIVKMQIYVLYMKKK